MRLYNTEGATQVDDPEFGTIKPDATGAFNGLPDPMYAKLFGRPGWENDEQRAARLVAEQQEKLRDPATMLAELQKMTASQGELTAILANAFAAAQAPAVEVPRATVEKSVGEDGAEVEPEESGEAAEESAIEEQAPAEPAKKSVRSPRAAKKAAASPPSSN